MIDGSLAGSLMVTGCYIFAAALPALYHGLIDICLCCFYSQLMVDRVAEWLGHQTFTPEPEVPDSSPSLTASWRYLLVALS